MYSSGIFSEFYEWNGICAWGSGISKKKMGLEMGFGIPHLPPFRTLLTLFAMFAEGDCDSVLEETKCLAYSDSE